VIEATQTPAIAKIPVERVYKIDHSLSQQLATVAGMPLLAGCVSVVRRNRQNRNDRHGQLVALCTDLPDAINGTSSRDRD
jgi:hypothetical protein